MAKTWRVYRINAEVYEMFKVYFAVSRRPSRHLEIQVGSHVFTTEPGEQGRNIPPDGTDPDNPIIHRSGCSWETMPYCDCGADPERVDPPA